jgi:uncharacterized protein
MRTKKVLTSARLKASESTAQLNVDAPNKAVLVGRRKEGAPGRLGLIGKVCESAQVSSVLDAGVWLDVAFPHVIGIFGSRGSGKSFDLGVIAEAVAGMAATAGGTAQTWGVVIFDVQDQFWTLGRQPDPALVEDESQLAALRAWGLSPDVAPRVNLWAPMGYRTPLPGVRELQLAPSQLTADDWLALVDVERFSSIGQALLTLVRDHPNEDPATLAQRCLNTGSLASFQSSTVEALRWRLESLAGVRLIGPSAIALDDLLAPGCISVVLMRQLGESLRPLVVGVVTRLLADRMSYHHQTKRVARRLQTAPPEGSMPDRLWVLLDEAHVVVPASGTTAATASVIDYVKRGRDAGLSMVFATQQPSAVDPRLMSQVDLTLTHFLGFDADLQAAVARMPTRASVVYEVESTKGVDVANVLRSLDPGECIVADAMSGRIFAAKIRPRVSAHGGNTPT